MRPQTIVSMLVITPLLSWAFNCAAQVQSTPTPTATPRLLVTAKLTQVSGHSIIACTVKNSSGKAVRSQIVSVQKAAAVTGPFANWMSKKTAVNGQALLPYAHQRTRGTCDAPPRTRRLRCPCSACHEPLR